MRQNRPRSGIPPWLTIACAIMLVLSSASTTLAAGKPGYPDKVEWSGVTWAVKTSRSPVGPGPNIFSKANVSVVQGRLHLRIAKDAAGTWTTAEIIGPRTYGYGTYSFTIESAVNDLDPNVVLGLFTWSDRARFAHREIDIEFARWGNAADSTNAQHVVQPWNVAGHQSRFTQAASTKTTHRFTWGPGRIDWLSTDANGVPFASYAYAGADVPPSGDERVRLNLWLFNGTAPTDGRPVEVIIDSFVFTP